jgi:hypothetical protein
MPGRGGEEPRIAHRDRRVFFHDIKRVDVAQTFFR